MRVNPPSFDHIGPQVRDLAVAQKILHEGVWLYVVHGDTELPLIDLRFGSRQIDRVPR